MHALFLLPKALDFFLPSARCPQALRYGKKPSSWSARLDFEALGKGKTS